MNKSPVEIREELEAVEASIPREGEWADARAGEAYLAAMTAMESGDAERSQAAMQAYIRKRRIADLRDDLRQHVAEDTEEPDQSPTEEPEADTEESAEGDENGGDTA